MPHSWRRHWLYVLFIAVFSSSFCQLNVLLLEQGDKSPGRVTTAADVNVVGFSCLQLYWPAKYICEIIRRTAIKNFPYKHSVTHARHTTNVDSTGWILGLRCSVRCRPATHSPPRMGVIRDRQRHRPTYTSRFVSFNNRAHVVNQLFAQHSVAIGRLHHKDEYTNYCEC